MLYQTVKKYPFSMSCKKIATELIRAQHGQCCHPSKRLWDFQYPIYLSSTFTISLPGLFQESLNVLVWETSFISVHIQPQVSSNQ